MNNRDFLVGSKTYDGDRVNSIKELERKEENNKEVIDRLINKDSDNDSNNNNPLLNMSLVDIYHKLINILPNLYNDYNKEYLEKKIHYKENEEYVNDNQIVRESIVNLIFNSENIVYIGLWFIIISISLYVLGL
tara:strand:+ start:75 stop:476 length:402 start_codon:yes stop_codon:yes gene_type:complete